MMVIRKSLSIVLFACFAAAGSLAGNPVFLSLLERDGDSVGIVGIDTEDWQEQGGGKVYVHVSLKLKSLERDKLYIDELKPIIRQQASRNVTYGEMRVDFLLEGRRRSKYTLLFPYKLFRSYERRIDKNINLSCRNIWNENVERLVCFVCNKKGTERVNYDKNQTIVMYKEFFAKALKDYRTALRMAGVDDATEEEIFVSYVEALEEIVEILGVWGKKLGNNSGIFTALKKMKKMTGKKCRLTDLIYYIINFYWTADYFTRIIFSHGNKGIRKTIIICNLDSAQEVEDMLLRLDYKRKYICDTTCKKKLSERNLPPYRVRTFINHVIGRCNVCGEFGKSKCSACKKVFYCGGECQKSDWKRHKNFCERVPKKKKKVVKKKKKPEVFKREKLYEDFLFKGPGETIENLREKKAKKEEEEFKAPKGFDFEVGDPQFCCCKCGFTTDDIEEYFDHRPINGGGMEKKDAKPCLGMDFGDESFQFGLDDEKGENRK